MKFIKCPSAIVFDFDGTLSESRQPIKQENVTLLAKLAEHTIVAVMSGSGFDIIEKNLLSHLPKQILKENVYIFPNAASQCYISSHNVWNAVYDFSFSNEERQTVMRALETAVVKTRIAEGLPQYGPRIDDRGTEIAFAGLGIDAPLALKQQWDSDQKKRLPLQTMLREQLPDFDVHVGGTTTVEVTKKGINKAYGIEWLSQRLTVKPKDMLFVGDALSSGGNDAVVIPTGIQTCQVSGPEETARVIEKLCEICSK